MSYDPSEGRWTARDPIGFAGGDENIYNYVSNNPTDQTDPTGLQGVSPPLPMPTVPDKTLPQPVGPKLDPAVTPAGDKKEKEVYLQIPGPPGENQGDRGSNFPIAPQPIQNPAILPPGSPNNPATPPSRADQVVCQRRVRVWTVIGYTRMALS